MLSKNGRKIRLTDERWLHIIEQHCEMAGLKNEVMEAIENPDQVLEGYKGALLAVKKYGSKKFLIVVYSEKEEEGFVVTAFITSKKRYLKKRKQLWP